MKLFRPLLLRSAGTLLAALPLLIGSAIAAQKDDERVNRLLDEVKQREAIGYAYEAADASVELLARRILGRVPSYFDVEKFELQSTQHFTGGAGKSSVQILVATNGAATLNAHGCDPVQFGKGDGVVVPASISTFEVLPEGSVQFLKSSVPGMPVSDPEIMKATTE